MWYELSRPERVTPETFSSEPLLVGGDDPHAVIFGNSGFRLDLVRRRSGLDERLFHYTPEGKMSPTGFRARYAKMLGAALYSLWSWLKFPPSTQTELARQFDRVQTTTNDTLARSIAHLFDNWGHGDLVEVSNTEYGNGKRIKIDLLRYKDLPQDDPLISQLGKYADLASELKINS